LEVALRIRPKRPLTIGFALLLAVSLIWPVMAIIDLVSVMRGYPYASADPTTASPYGFPYRSDTDYVAWAVRQTGVTFHGRPFTNDWDGGQPGLDQWGEPSHWSVYAISLGFTVDHNPAIGAVAEWTAADATGRQGHVAMVTHTSRDGRIDIDEYDFPTTANGYARHAFSHRADLSPADLYIHLERPLPGGIWDPATTPSGTIDDPATIVIDADDNGNGGLDHIAVTASELTDDGTWTPWEPIRLIALDGGPHGTITIAYAMPGTVACAQLSFDVFSRNRSTDGSYARQLAPSGLRHYSRHGITCPIRP
jgi:hypothetical protein